MMEPGLWCVYCQGEYGEHTDQCERPKSPAPPAAEPDAATVKESLTVQLFERIARNHRRWAAYARLLAKAHSDPALVREYTEQAAEMERDADALRAAGWVPVDDGEAVTAEKLIAVGYEHYSGDDYVSPRGPTFRFWYHDGPKAGTQYHPRWMIAAPGITDAYPDIKTMGEHRRICSALGITLPAPADVKGGE